MVNLSNYLSHVPEGLVNTIKGSRAESIYRQAQLEMLSTETHRVITPCGEFEFEIPIETNGGEYLRSEIASKGVHEPVLTEALCDVLGSVDVFYDIGTHFGYFLKIASTCGVKDQNIFAFENHGMRSRYLKRRFPNIHLTPEYVGDGDGTIAIDDYVSDYQPPTVVKIDVEGAEYEVLTGMKQVLENHSPLIYLELHKNFLSERGLTPADCTQILQDYSYKIEVVNHRAKGVGWMEIGDPINENNVLVRARK